MDDRDLQKFQPRIPCQCCRRVRYHAYQYQLKSIRCPTRDPSGALAVKSGSRRTGCSTTWNLVLLEVDGWPDRTFEISGPVLIKEVAIGHCGRATGNRELNQAGSDGPEVLVGSFARSLPGDALEAIVCPTRGIVENPKTIRSSCPRSAWPYNARRIVLRAPNKTSASVTGKRKRLPRGTLGGLRQYLYLR